LGEERSEKMRIRTSKHKFLGFYITKPVGVDARDLIVVVGWFSLYFDFDGVVDEPDLGDYDE